MIRDSLIRTSALVWTLSSLALTGFASDKQTLHDQLAHLGQRIRMMRSAGADPVAISQLEQSYRELSQRLGGDVPADVDNPLPSASASAFSTPQLASTPVPPGSSASTIQFTKNIPVAILDLQTAVSTITVVSAQPYLWDLDLRTFITHTYSGDLDITLTSPNGTVAVVSTDNGGSTDNVFNGTLWDDTPLALPCTDFIYTNGVTATPLNPEGSFAIFRGENANGVWTLSIFDDVGGDVGTLNSWGLAITSLPSAPNNPLVTIFANTTPVAIPDLTPVTSQITVTGMGNRLEYLDSVVDIDHTWSNDLDFSLTSPAGTTVIYSTDNGGSFDNVFSGTLFGEYAVATVTDYAYVNLTTATNLSPEGSFDNFVGENPNGVWTITIFDDTATDVGTLNNWDLLIRTSGGALHSYNVDIGTANAAPSAGYGGAANQPGTWNAVDAATTGFALLNTNGVATGASCAPALPGFNFSFNNVNTAGDNELLMDDLQDIGGVGASTTWNVTGLANGVYRVYVNAWAPDNRVGFITNVTVNGGLAGVQPCGGANWGGAHAQGVTYVVDNVWVTSGTLSFTASTLAGFGNLNGFQIVETGIPMPSTGCVPGVSLNGCALQIGFGGVPSVTASSGFNVACTSMDGQRSGGFFYGLGPNFAPFGTGTAKLCIAPPTQRFGGLFPTGGTIGSCNGGIVVDLAAWLAGHPGALGMPFVAGSDIYIQAWNRDNGNGSRNIATSNSLHVTFFP